MCHPDEKHVGRGSVAVCNVSSALGGFRSWVGCGAAALGAGLQIVALQARALLFFQSYWEPGDVTRLAPVSVATLRGAASTALKRRYLKSVA